MNGECFMEFQFFILKYFTKEQNFIDNCKYLTKKISSVVLQLRSLFTVKVL